MPRTSPPTRPYSQVWVGGLKLKLSLVLTIAQTYELPSLHFPRVIGSGRENFGHHSLADPQRKHDVKLKTPKVELQSANM
jgi:hypothetical protein